MMSEKIMSEGFEKILGGAAPNFANQGFQLPGAARSGITDRVCNMLEAHTPKTLLEELRARRDLTQERIKLNAEEGVSLAAKLADVERAIAALEPAPEPSRAELEAETYGARIHHNDIASIGYADAVGYPPDQPETPIPEGFVAWGGGEWTGDPETIVDVIMSDKKHDERKKLAGQLLEAEANFAHHWERLQEADLEVIGAQDRQREQAERFSKANWCLQQAKAAMFVALNAEFGPAEPDPEADEETEAPRSAAGGQGEDSLQEAPDQPETPIPEGFVAWEGGECPVAEPQAFEVVLANGERRLSNEFFWPWETDSWACGADIGLNIIAYRLLPPTETADETPEAAERSNFENGDNLAIIPVQILSPRLEQTEAAILQDQDEIDAPEPELKAATLEDA